VLSSPNYPNNYDSDRQCEYDIIAPQGKVIALNVLDFDIEQHSTCEFDYLEIFDSSAAENSTSLGRFCGSNKPDEKVSSFNHMHIEFASDTSVFGRGFQANYSFVDVKCGGLIKDAKELVKPPMDENENGVYEPNSLCKWLILAPKGFVIQMNVLDFELEHDSACKYDYLTIYNNGSGNGEQIGPYCGTNVPKVITTVDNIATIVFASDSSTSKDGFTISFNFIDGTKCGLKSEMV
jgi:cubilin